MFYFSSLHPSIKTIFFTTISVAMASMASLGMEARIVEQEISSIAEALNYFPVDATGVVVAADWDETIIKIDGDDNSGLREGETTKQVIEKIQLLKYDFFILTSRYAGSSLVEIDEKYIDKKGDTVPFEEIRVRRAMQHLSKAMTTTYDLFPSDDGTFFFDGFNGPQCLELNDKTLSLNERYFGDDTALLTPNMVFAGSHANDKSRKGKLMAKLLDLHADALRENKGDTLFRSRKPITHVIFIDNDPDHIAAMRKAFAGRKENLTLLYYPNHSRK